MDRIGLSKYRISSFKRRTICIAVVSLLAILLISNIAGATIYRWIPSGGTTIAAGIETSWGSCGSQPTAYVITLLTTSSSSGCNHDDWHESGTLDPAIDLFFNTSYAVDTNVQGNWYYGRLKDTSSQNDIFTFRLIYANPDGTIGILPGTGGMTVGAPADKDYNISLTGISGIVPAGAKLGLRISKTGISGMKIYFGDTASKTEGKSGYFSVTETASGGDTTPPDTIIDSTPPTLTNINSAGFTFHSTEAGTFQCQLDGSGFSACSSPKSYADLLDGSHTFDVKATDAAGNTDTTPATYTWNVDTIPPVITRLDSSPISVTVGSTYTDTGATASDNNDGDLTSSIMTVNPVDTNIAGTYTVTYDVSDAAGNPAAQVTRTVIVGAIPTYSVSGYVFDNFGEVLGGVFVQNNSNSATTAPDGSYSISGLQSSVYTFSYSKAGFDTDYLEVSVSGNVLNVNVTLYDTTPPGQVIDLIGDTPTHSIVDLLWDPVVDASTYEVFRDSVSIGFTSNNYFSDTGLIGETTYIYSVRAFDAYNNIGANSNLLSITTPAIVYYIPFLYQRADNIYDAGVQVQNHGSTQANVEITFYFSNGNIAGTDTFVVQPGELMTKHAFDLVTGQSIFVGPAVVKSNVPIIAQGYINTVSQEVYSIAPSFTNISTSSYIPFLYQRADNIYDAGIQVFNPGLVPATITIKLYYANGTLAGTGTYTAGSKAEVTKYVFDLVTGQSIFTGSAEITSDQPIVAQGYIRTRATNTYSIAPAVITSVVNSYIPFLYQRADNIYDAGVQVFNPGPGTASITINMYNADGTLAGVGGPYTVAAKAEVNKYVFDMVTGQSIFTGPAEISSDQPVVSQGFIRTKASNIYSIAPQVRKPVVSGDIHVPFVYQTVSATHDGGIQAMNPNSVPANIDITLYYPNGAIAGSYSQIVLPYAELSKYIFDIAPNTVDFNGSAIVTSDQSIVSQGFIRKKSTNIYSIAPPVER